MKTKTITIDQISGRYARWNITAIERIEKRKRHVQYWVRAKCDCGTERVVNFATIRYGKSRSCGCLVVDVQRARIAERNRLTATEKAKEILASGLKSCSFSGCKQQNPQPLENFSRSRSTKTGLIGWCKACGIEEKYLRRYGIRSEDLEKIRKRQKYLCGNPRCGKKLAGKDAHVDHDHETGTVRGVLCANCNRAIGQVNDSPIKAFGLYEYLISHSQLRMDPRQRQK